MKGQIFMRDKTVGVIKSLKWINWFFVDFVLGTFTVFAPTNQAFEKLPAATLAYLSNNTQALADILKYHVVPGTVMKSAASNELQVASLSGNKIRFNIYPFNNMVIELRTLIYRHKWNILNDSILSMFDVINKEMIC